MEWRKTRPRESALVVAVAATVFLSGCGSGAEQRAAPPPTLPRAVALGLARASDDVAAALAAGDNCRALTLAQALRERTTAAVAGANVPPRLRRPLQAAANDLAGRIECTPPPRPVETSPAEGDKEHGKGKHKGEKKRGKEHD